VIRDYFGPELLVDLQGCSISALTNRDFLFEFLRDFPEAIGMKRISEPNIIYYGGCPDPLDYGMSGSVFLAESSVSFHSFPNREGSIFINIFTCSYLDENETLNKLKSLFHPSLIEYSFIKRGKFFKR
jgi:S-adenosylmethionine/arginine decarboxylase-like enzyme